LHSGPSSCSDVDGAVPGDADLIAAIDATVGERLLVVAGPEGAKALPLEPG
jgi:hypothetical protein